MTAIVAAVDDSATSARATQAAVRTAQAMRLPIVFVHVRRGPSGALGEPYHQRRLDTARAAGNRTLKDALAVAQEAGISATWELLEGPPARRIVEFARVRKARLVVVGSRRRLVGGSVSRRVIRHSDRPVLIAGLPPTMR